MQGQNLTRKVFVPVVVECHGIIRTLIEIAVLMVAVCKLCMLESSIGFPRLSMLPPLPILMDYLSLCGNTFKIAS